MGNPVEIVANVATGGLYSVAKGVKKAVTTGKVLAGVADIMASFGIGGNILQPTVGTKNALAIQGAVAGAALAAAPAGSVFSGGFGAAGQGVAPLAASPGAAGLTAGGPVTASSIPAGGVPLAPGVAPSTAEVAGASLVGPVGAAAAPASTGTGLLTTSASKVPWAGMNEGQAGWGVAKSIPTNPAEVSGWWANLPELGKYAILAGGTQLIAGGASGMFAGMSAQQKLNLEKLINEQNQTQRQRLNTQNAYVPKLNFGYTPGPAGLLTQPKAT